MSHELHACYILHTRPYRDSSLLVDLFSVQQGRVRAVLKAARGTSKSARLKRSAVQPFTPLLASWSGRSELKSIYQLEVSAAAIPLQGERLYSALYLNEVLVRVLKYSEESSENPKLFSLYENSLHQLVHHEHYDLVLRHFEFSLLELLGYGLVFDCDFETGEAVNDNYFYRYIPDSGFVRIEEKQLAASHQSNVLFSGAELLALASNELHPGLRQLAKRICRQAMRTHLGAKPLKSRELFL